MNCPKCGEVEHLPIPEDESHCDQCQAGIPLAGGVGFWCWCRCHAWSDDLRLIADWQADPLGYSEHSGRVRNTRSI